MRRRTILGGLSVALALAILLSLVPTLAHVLQAGQPNQAEPVPDLSTLLNYPYGVSIEDLEGTEREEVISTLMARPEAAQLRIAMAEKGFFANLANAEAMRVTADGGAEPHTIAVAVVPMGPGQGIFLPLVMRSYSSSSSLLAHVDLSSEPPVSASPEDLSAYLVAMLADDGTGFFQAHHTNLDPRLAEDPGSPIVVNDMPYFYVTTLQVVGPRIVRWSYWWFDSHHHPNWYYACYRSFWDYYALSDHPWPWWHHWAYGWYYWRFWYYWSTWFPWYLPPVD